MKYYLGNTKAHISYQMKDLKSQPRIISDTNIWYGIADGSIPEKSIENLNLVLISNSLREFSISPNIKANPKLLQRACLMALTKSKRIIYDSSLDIIIKTFDKKYVSNIDFMLKTHDEIRRFTRVEPNEIYNIPDELMSPVLKEREDVQKICNQINNAILPNIRSKIKKGGSKKEHRDKSGVSGILSLINMYVQQYTSNSISLPDPYDFKEIEVFIRTWEVFFKELELSKMKIKVNDWFDLFNIVFVNNDSLYWTRDEKWKKFIAKAGYEDKLFDI